MGWDGVMRCDAVLGWGGRGESVKLGGSFGALVNNVRGAVEGGF